jgi:hypothetical protein
MATCKVCKTEKGDSDFTRTGAKRSQCRDCVRAYSQKYYATHKARLNQRNTEWVKGNRDRRLDHLRKYQRENASRVARASRQSHLLRKYGLSVCDYEAACERASHACEICGETCPTGTRLSVDHDHMTGSLRGLLCRWCNAGLGHFRDDPTRLAAAVAYLNRGGVFSNKETVA